MKKASLVLIVAVALIALTLFAQDGNIVRVNQAAYAVSDPSLVAVSATPAAAFALNTTQGVGRVLLRTIQNTGTVPILYRINSSTVDSTHYHGVIAAGSTARDGLGSVLDVSRIPYPIYLATESSTSTAALVELTQ